mgnify:CR=1 FL=1
MTTDEVGGVCSVVAQVASVEIGNEEVVGGFAFDVGFCTLCFFVFLLFQALRAATFRHFSDCGFRKAISKGGVYWKGVGWTQPL